MIEALEGARMEGTSPIFAVVGAGNLVPCVLYSCSKCHIVVALICLSMFDGVRDLWNSRV